MHFAPLMKRSKASNKKKTQNLALTLPVSGRRWRGGGAGLGRVGRKGSPPAKNKNDLLVLSAFWGRAARQRKNEAAFQLKGLALNFDTLMVSRILDNILSYNVLLRHGNGIKTR